MKKSLIFKVVLILSVMVVAFLFSNSMAATPTSETCELTVTVSSVDGRGSLEVNPPGEVIGGRITKTYTYPVGTVVTLKAIDYFYPDGAKTLFHVWQGDLTGNQNPAAIVMNGNKSVTAVFVHGDPVPTPRRITPTQRVTPTPRRPVTPTPTPTIVPPTPTPTRSSGGIILKWVIVSDWGIGATIEVTIINNTPNDINGWTMSWIFSGNQTIANYWNCVLTQSGNTVSVKDAGFNAKIPANGGSVTFGFNISYSGTNSKPTSFTFNGIPWQVQ